MGYDTYFEGSLKFDKPVEAWLVDYINKFNKTRRMQRDNEKIKELFPNWKELCFNGDLGEQGEYFVGGRGFYGQDRDESIVNYNYSPYNQPGLWCKWTITETELMWDDAEKFYDYVEWLRYLIKNFFAPLGYTLNGDICWSGENRDDFGTIHVVNNVIAVEYGIYAMSMSDLKTEDLIKELLDRGFAVRKHEQNGLMSMLFEKFNHK